GRRARQSRSDAGWRAGTGPARGGCSLSDPERVASRRRLRRERLARARRHGSRSGSSIRDADPRGVRPARGPVLAHRGPADSRRAGPTRRGRRAVARGAGTALVTAAAARLLQRRRAGAGALAPWFARLAAPVLLSAR